MRALTLTRHGGPEVLQVRTAPDPTPGPDEVLIRVERAGLNFADISARVGLYPDAPPPPCVLGYEVAGTVVAHGAGVSGPPVGTRVLALSHFGGQADLRCVPAVQAFPLPDEMSFDEGAALPVNYLTAFHVLFHVASVRPGARVLLHMAAGGVGLAAIQLARTVPGVELFGTASQAKHALLKDAGVQHPIDYRTQDYADEVRRLTEGRGVDLVIDPLGGADWAKGYGLLAPAGHLVALGWSNMVKSEKRSLFHVGRQLLSVKRYSPYQLMNENRSVSGVNLGHLWNERSLLRGHMEKLLRLYAEKRVAPRVDRVFDLNDGPAAHRYVQERRNVGKVLFRCA